MAAAMAAGMSTKRSGHAQVLGVTVRFYTLTRAEVLTVHLSKLKELYTKRSDFHI